MARMEMDYNLKTLVNFFQVPSVYCGVVVKTAYSLFFPG